MAFGSAVAVNATGQLVHDTGGQRLCTNKRPRKKQLHRGQAMHCGAWKEDVNKRPPEGVFVCPERKTLPRSLTLPEKAVAGGAPRKSVSTRRQRERRDSELHFTSPGQNSGTGSPKGRASRRKDVGDDTSVHGAKATPYNARIYTNTRANCTIVSRESPATDTEGHEQRCGAAK